MRKITCLWASMVCTMGASGFFAAGLVWYCMDQDMQAQGSAATAIILAIVGFVLAVISWRSGETVE